MRTFVLHKLDERGRIVDTTAFKADSLEDARRYARARLPGYTEVQVHEGGVELFRERTPKAPPRDEDSGAGAA